MAKKTAIEKPPTPQRITEGSIVRFQSTHPLYAGQSGVVTQRTDGASVIVELESGDRIHVSDWHLSPRALQTDREYLTLDEIAIDGGTQSRAKLNLETVEEYATDMVAGAEFPPVEVYYDGSSYWLADGFHRLAAYKKNQELDPDNGNWQNIAAKIHQGDRRDAILHSVGANSNHGLRRSNADKRRAVITLLNDEEWKGWSDREIARRCSVDHKFVGKLRKEVTGDIPSEDRTYTTRHGTEATMNTTNIGCSSARDMPNEEHQVLSASTSVSTQLPLVQPQDLVNPPKSKKAQLLPDVDRNGDVPPGEPEPIPASVVNLNALAHGKTEIVSNEWTIGFMSNMDCLTQDQLEAIVSLGLASLESDRYYQAMKNLDSIACRAMIKANKQVLNERHHPDYFKEESA